MPAQVAGLFRRSPRHCPWWIAGGHAIEMFVGRPLRPHADIDVLLLRRDQGIVHEILPGWDVQAADPPGRLRPWPVGETLPDTVHDIWCRAGPSAPWRVQFMLDEADGPWWHSRRDHRVRMPVGNLGRHGRGLPYLTPEVQLFYKADGARAKDELDFAAAAPHLGEAAREWLDHALGLTLPDHPWRAALA